LMRHSGTAVHTSRLPGGQVVAGLNPVSEPSVSPTRVLAVHGLVLTGLRPSPTRHAFGRQCSGGSGRRVKTVTGGPARCMNRHSGWLACWPPHFRPEPVMTVARSVHDVLDQHVRLEVECIDRMYLNVYVPGLQYAPG